MFILPPIVFDFGSLKRINKGKENKIIHRPVIGKLILIFSKVELFNLKIGFSGSKNIP